VKCIKAETFPLVFSVRIGLSLCWVLVCAIYLLARFWVRLLRPEQVLGSPAGLLSQAGRLASALSEFRCPVFQSAQDPIRVKRAAYFAFQIFVFFGQWSGSALPSQGFRLCALSLHRHQFSFTLG
jgi:hypothetical protein